MRIRHRGRSFLVPIPGTNHTISILDGEQDVPDDIAEQLIRQGRVDPVYIGPTPPDEATRHLEGAGSLHGDPLPPDTPYPGAPLAASSVQSAQSVDSESAIQPGAPTAEPPDPLAEDRPATSSARSRRKS